MGASDSRRCGHGTSACALYPAPGAPPRRRRVSRVPGPCFEDVPPLITTAAPTTSFSRCSAADGRLPHLRAGSPAATVFSGPPRVRLRYGPSPVLTLTGLCQAAWYFGLPLYTCLRLRGEREIAAVGTSQPTSMVRVWLGARRVGPGAIDFAPVSPSSNRTCGFPAYGSPTPFTSSVHRASSGREAVQSFLLQDLVDPWLEDLARPLARFARRPVETGGDEVVQFPEGPGEVA
jgi:hypothetical protein